VRRRLTQHALGDRRRTERLEALRTLVLVIPALRHMARERKAVQQGGKAARLQGGILVEPLVVARRAALTDEFQCIWPRSRALSGVSTGAYES